jgi:polar amino acid transport system substrate-binding protein
LRFFLSTRCAQLHERHRDLVPKVGEVIEQMEPSGELATLREALVKRVLSAP